MVYEEVNTNSHPCELTKLTFTIYKSTELYIRMIV